MPNVQEAYLKALHQIQEWILENIIKKMQPSDRIYVSFGRKDAKDVRNIGHFLAVCGSGVIVYQEGTGQDWFFGENAGFANLYSAQDRVAEDLVIAWPVVKEKLLAEIQPTQARDAAILAFQV